MSGKASRRGSFSPTPKETSSVCCVRTATRNARTSDRSSCSARHAVSARMAGVAKPTDTRRLKACSLTYTPVGATAASDEVWGTTPSGFRRYERTVPVAMRWDDARSLMLRWGVKTRSGFEVNADGTADPTVREGERAWLRLAVGPVKVTEPVRVIAVVDHPLRCGFSYGTLEGHPVSGEEAFVLHRATESAPVQLTIRSLTRASGKGVWRYSFPMLLVAQWVFRRRYLRSLNG